MGQLTINTTSAQDARIVEAFGDFLGTVDENGDPRNATGAEVKAAIVNKLKQVVYNYERRQAVATAEAGIAGLDPS